MQMNATTFPFNHCCKTRGRGSVCGCGVCSPPPLTLSLPPSLPPILTHSPTATTAGYAFCLLYQSFCFRYLLLLSTFNVLAYLRLSLYCLSCMQYLSSTFMDLTGIFFHYLTLPHSKTLHINGLFMSKDNIFPPNGSINERFSCNCC